MLGRRAFLAGSGLVLGCRGKASEPPDAAVPIASSVEPVAPVVSVVADAGPPRSIEPLFDRYPALGRSLPRVDVGFYPSRVDLVNGVHIKRDDDFTLDRDVPKLSSLFGGGKVRKLALFLGEAKALGKKTLVTVGGVGSNQAVAVAILGKALGFEVRLHLVPQPPSTLVTKNLGADAAAGATIRSFDSTTEAESEAKRVPDAYVISAGGTTPLGTLGFVNAAFELADDVKANRLPAPHRIYVALGLGGTAAGLALGCAMAGLDTEVVAVRASNPGTVSPATLRRIEAETIEFARARDASFAKDVRESRIRIDGRFVGAGYGAPTKEGNDAIARWKPLSLDPVYTGKAFAALLADREAGFSEPALFWNTMSSRPIQLAPVPPAFQRYVK